MSHSRTHAACRIVAAFAFALALLPVNAAHATPSAPSNAAIEAKRAEAVKAGEKLDQLATDLESRSEEYQEIQSALEQTNVQISLKEDELTVARSDEASAQALLRGRAANIYRGGRLDVFSVLMGVTDFQDFVTRLDFLRRINQGDAALVASVKDARGRVENAKQALESRKDQQIALRNSARAKAIEVQDAYNAQNVYLASINADLKKLIAEERERLERIAAEKAAAAAAAARLRSNATVLDFDPAKLGAPRPEVVSVARRYLGVRYVWGGTTPAGFDCSGLTQFAYAQIGVSIPRTSRSQFRFGAYIPPNRLDLLQPGDLVFFGTGGDPTLIHHVGMYVGEGNFIHAPQTGDVVRITSLLGRIEEKGDYVGAARP